MSLPASIKRKLEVFGTALKLGLTSFGGPLAHIGFFHEEYVNRKKWLDEESFTDLVALCQFLPGPASSQLGIGIGTMRAGLTGGILAWIGFTLPSAILLTAFELFIHAIDPAAALWLGGIGLSVGADLYSYNADYLGTTQTSSKLKQKDVHLKFGFGVPFGVSSK